MTAAQIREAECKPAALKKIQKYCGFLLQIIQCGIVLRYNRYNCIRTVKERPNVRKAVDDFVQDFEQFDDLTMLCIKYNENGSAISGEKE